MITKLTAIWLLAVAAAGAVSSCADDDAAEPYAPQAGDGSVSISFTISSASTTRGGTRANTTTGSRTSTNTRANETTSGETSTEAGDNSLNENTITRLDLYVFASSSDDATMMGHKYCIYNNETQETTSGYGTLTYSTEADSKLGTCTGTWTDTGLYYTKDELEGKTVYLIANWDEAASASIATLADLKAAKIGSDDFSPATKQTKFVMDSKPEKLTTDSNVTKIEDGTTATYTINSIELSRALAKIRLTALKDDGTEITTYTSGEKSVEYTLNNYAKYGSVIADGTDLTATTTLETLQTIKGSDLLQQKNKSGKEAAVFYSYPNNWFDSSKNIREEEPINAARQTYIQLYAPYTNSDNKEIWGYYKIYVNYRLQEDNDADKDEVNVDQTLYQLQRNYIYDITARIDREGGTQSDPVTLTSVKYQAVEWDENKGGDITFD